MQIFQKCLVMAKISTDKAVKVKMCCLCWEEPFTNNKYRNNSCGTVTMAGTGLSEWPKVFRILYVYMFDINVWHRFSLLRAFCSSAGFVFFWLGASQYGRSKSHNFHSSPSRKALKMRPKITTSGRPTSRTLENGAFKDIFGSRAAKWGKFCSYWCYISGMVFENTFV